MNSFFARLILVAVALLQLSTSAYSGTLDNYYLEQFGESKSASLQKAVLSLPADVQESARCGMPLKRALKRDWNLLELTTQKVLAKQLALPVVTNAATPLNSAGGHFIIHYSSSGAEAPNIAVINSYTGLGLTSPIDWAVKVAEAFETAYSYYNGTIGYHMPPQVPDQRYHIYLTSLSGIGEYGETDNYYQDDLYNNGDNSIVFSGAFNHSSPSYIIIDRDFTNSIFKPGTYTPLQSLLITAAHEYHHAIQFGYNYYFDTWYAEATSTWMEDEVHDSVNQLYSYIPAWFTQSRLSLDTPVNLSTGGGYGRWIFNRYLAEQHTPAMLRGVWEKVAALDSPNGYSDIPMAPVLDSLLSSDYGSSLGNEFFGFAKRVYTRAWTDHPSEIDKIHTYAPVTTYSTYPVSATSVTLSHYSFAYYKFLPASSAPYDLKITVAGTSGIKATTFIKSGGGLISEYTFLSENMNVNGASIVIPGFSSSSEVVLVIVNATASDNLNVSLSTDGSTVFPVNGSCGSANNSVYLTSPTLNLCSSGTASAAAGTGPWNWSCSGSNGGATATCSAFIETPIPTENITVTSGNATITPPSALPISGPEFQSLETTKPSNLIATAAVTFTLVTSSGGTVKIQVVPGDVSWPPNPVFYLVKNTVWTKLVKGADYLIDSNNNLILSLSGIGINKAVASSTDTRTLVVGTELPSTTGTGSSSAASGCFIATAAYGSYLHPQVQLLRDFRDQHLLTNAPGRVFVSLYYRYSPPLANFIARHPFLRGVTRLALTPLVAAIIHPLIALMSLLLFSGAVLMAKTRRAKTILLNVDPDLSSTTSCI